MVFYFVIVATLMIGCGRNVGPFACCSVIQGNSVNLLQRVPNKFRDALISDPPYGINTRTDYTSRGGRKFSPIFGDDKPFDPAHLLSFRKIVLFGGNHFASRLPDSPTWLIWDKRCGLRSCDYADSELAWSNLGGPAKEFHHLWSGFMRESERGAPRVHPTQKPIALMLWVLRKVGRPRLVVDPYAGSGTTLVAAKMLGLHFLGFEISRQYCTVIRKRLCAVNGTSRLEFV
jgi:site-specific DNA-methyltransferase (adenine-specific)/modification methylase